MDYNRHGLRYPRTIYQGPDSCWFSSSMCLGIRKWLSSWYGWMWGASEIRVRWPTCFMIFCPSIWMWLPYLWRWHWCVVYSTYRGWQASGIFLTMKHSLGVMVDLVHGVGLWLALLWSGSFLKVQCVLTGQGELLATSDWISAVGISGVGSWE